jgi:uncharacterized protein (TIGR02118 family)
MAMVKLIVLLRNRSRQLGYGDGYNTFLMLVDDLPGLRRKAVSNVYAGPGGAAPFEAVVELYFDDRAALRTALTSPVGVEAGQKLLDFAGPDAVTLFAHVLEEEIDTG